MKTKQMLKMSSFSLVWRRSESSRSKKCDNLSRCNSKRQLRGKSPNKKWIQLSKVSCVLKSFRLKTVWRNSMLNWIKSYRGKLNTHQSLFQMWRSKCKYIIVELSLLENSNLLIESSRVLLKFKKTWLKGFNHQWRNVGNSRNSF